MGKAARQDLVVIIVLIIVAAFFRFYRLNEVPLGLWRDEAANGIEALRVLDGHLAIFYGTREPLFIYLVALSVAFLGRTPIAVRVVAALAGTATIPITYLLVKEIFRLTDRRARVTAFLTSLWLTTSYWHLNFSRLGFRGVLLPLFASLSFYLLWRGWNRLHTPKALVWFALSGFCFALAFYTYTPSRILPLLLLPFLVQGARRAWTGIRAQDGVQKSTAPLASPIAAFAVFAICFAFVFAPLGAHFVAKPGSFLVRSEVSVFGALDEKPLASLLTENTLRQLGMFGFLGDPNTRHNPAGRPAFELFTLACFLVGLAVCLRRARSTPYVFCLLWFFAMLLPAILTYPELPHSLRAIGALPAAYIFPALGVEAAWSSLKDRTWCHKVGAPFSALVASCLVLTAVFTYRDYFAPRVEQIELIRAFDPRLVETASVMKELAEPHSVWIVPLGPHDEQRMAYYVLDFLYEGKAPYHYVHLDEERLAQELTEACQGRETARVLDRTGDWPAQPWYDLHADWRGLLPFLLDKHGQRLETQHFDGFDVLVYQLPDDVVFSFPSDLEPLDVDFGHGLRLTGATFGLGPPDSDQAWVALRWQVDVRPGADQAVEVTLTGASGEVVSSVRRLLLGEEDLPTSQWEVGQQEVHYYSLRGLPEPMGDGYSIHVSVYPADVEDGLESPRPATDEKRTFIVGSISSTGEALDWGRGVGLEGGQ
jgi:4-amino-4-deoxy-L-arabinose transferase-like glycosyltransferase